MKHALIIGGDGEGVDALEDSVWDAGYHSIVRVGSGREAWIMADTLRPSLIVVSPDCLSDVDVGQMCGLSHVTDAPIIVAGTRPDKALQCLKSAAPARIPARTEAFPAAIPNGVHPLLRAAKLPFPIPAAQFTQDGHSA